ncbi:copper homeostasis protein CutC [Paenibacillus sp. NPDC058177]|uniref:copper homeostasis protein CutC n=1 Tax=Paenibacillus sp. NPDC058177 TaxID=3346369 RepID=UPI0036DB23B1
MLLEVIATTLGDAVTAERYGADRIELIAGIAEGGLTPSLGLIEQVRAAVKIPVRVMIRPHARSFVYDESELRVMRRDIRHIASVGGLSLVLGVLHPDGTIDERALASLLEEAPGVPVTFHRAFDEVTDQLEALEVLLGYPQITDILTSGGRRTAPEGAERLAVLERLTVGKPLRILAGSGLTASGLSDFVRDTGVRRLHFGSAARKNGDPLRPVDAARVTEIRRILGSLK